jgi:putative ABC transport system permease protein
MLRLALRNLMARKGRLFMSALGVIASCTFLAGVFVFSDTITSSFDRLFANAYHNTSVVVRSSNVIKADFGADQRDTIDDSLIAAVKAVKGVSVADGAVSGSAAMTTAAGKKIGIDGPPKLGGEYTESITSPWKVVEGRAPHGDTEVLIDRRSSKVGKVKVGDKVGVTTTVGSKSFTVVGVATFAGNDTAGGSSWALFDLPTAQSFVTGHAGKLDGIAVRSDGSLSDVQLKASIEKALSGQKIEVLTRSEITKESQTQIEKGIGSFTTILTIFALIAVFVGCFIIYNVFKITTAQRLQENALLRAIGARSGQVVKAQMLEALAIGVVGGLLGFVAGIGLATAIITLLRAIGFAPSESGLAIHPMSFVWTMVVGILVTLACAVLPAIRAGRVPPLAALRDVSIDRTSHSRRRLALGVLSLIISAVGVAIGLAGSSVWLAPGVAGLFVAMVAFGPALVRPLSSAMVRPLRALRGVTGEIAARNAARSPERTALTSAALAICLALLIGVSTLGTSLVSSFRYTVAQQFRGDIAISASGNGQSGGLPTTVLDDVLKLPEVGHAIALGGALLRADDGSNKALTVLTINADQADSMIKLDFTGGGWADVHDTSVVVSKDKAKELSVVVGDSITASYLDGTKVSLKVAGIFDSNFLGGIVADRGLFAKSTAPHFDFQILATGKGGISNTNLKTAVKTVTDLVPVAKTQTRAEFIDGQVQQVSGILNFIYALLGMSVFIAVLGIVLTLMLSVYERRRELGLVRAIGMTRRQVRSSVRWESIVTAVIGATMGVALGVSLGWIVVKALADQGLNTFAVSITSVVVFTLLAMLFAVAAAWFPSRRAAKADILQAIATT